MEEAQTSSMSDRFIISVSEAELNLTMVLQNGQSFRWKPDTNRNGYLIGAACGFIWRLGRIDSENIECFVLGAFSRINRTEQSDPRAVLRRYLQLDLVILTDLHTSWCAADDKFARLAASNTEKFRGLRVLNQEPAETCFSFICSSNNRIPRIAAMVENLCRLYGESLSVDGEMFYDFPSIVTLAQSDNVSKTLRDASFGYRSTYIAETAQRLNELGGEAWLESLKTTSYAEAKAELVKLPGIGPKVADCICLMALDKPEAVPIDTHVRQVTGSLYMPKLKSSKSLTASLYKEIGDFYRETFGTYAGWAHEVLFSSNLKYFNDIPDPAQPSEKTGSKGKDRGTVVPVKRKKKR